MKVQNVIVGCGLSGIVLAERIANELKEEVLIIDRRDHIAGNIYDYNEKGITIHKYGPHAFHTKEKRLWEYVQQFSEFNTFQLRVSAWIDGQCVPVPFNFNSMEKLFPAFMAERIEKKLVEKFGYDVKVPILKLREEKDEDLAFLADFVYKNVFEGYTLKQWGLKPEEIDPTVTARVPVFVGRDDRYFQDPYQGIPVHGYTKMVEKMLDNPLIKVQLNTDWANVKDTIEYDRLFYTGSIDEFFNYSEGQLPYRSVYFKMQEYNVPYMQPTTTINYPTNYEWTRICEPKYFLNEQTSHTVLVREYSESFEL
ncbi:MAG: UDP-galactopyranose mutase, partial [Alphaproteobacteria bacterium]|nr:UDP-galactopyranose mutase [Alphaproteobacteria bacterium]